MKHWDKMSVNEKLDLLLEHESKTHDKIVEMIDRINDLADNVYQHTGEMLYRIDLPSKPIEKRKIN